MRGGAIDHFASGQFSVNKRDKSYMLTQFGRGSGSKNIAKIAKQVWKQTFFFFFFFFFFYASIYFCNALS